MVTTLDLRDVREPTIDDAPGLSGYLQQIVGEPFLFFRPSYADELTLHLGSPKEPVSSKLKHRVRGSYVLTFRGSIWTLMSVHEKSLTFADPFIKDSAVHTKRIELSDLEKSPPVKPGAQIVWAMPYLDELFGGFGLSLGFSDQSRLMLRPLPAALDNGDPDDLPPVADWELFTPFKRYLRVGPGSNWAYLPSMDEKKEVSAG